jgi:putative ABC transport system permease protein
MRRFFFRLLALLRPSQADDRLDREIASHLALIEDDLIRQGMTPDEARLAARRRFGWVDLTKEHQRDARSFVLLEDLHRDVRHAARTLTRTPGFTVAAILTLAIGIGGTTAVFSLIDAVLLQGLPFSRADRLVMVYENGTKFGFPRSEVAPVTWGGWSRLNDVFESTAAVTEFGAVLVNNGEPLRVGGRRVTSSLFEVLGAQALIGRVLLPEDDRPGSRVVVLANGLWHRRFGGDPAIVGRTIPINDEPYVVVGVMPKTFQFLESYVGLWVPAGFTSEELTNGSHYLAMVGRMKPGLAVSRAEADLDAIGVRIRPMLPADRDAPRAVIVPLKDVMSGDVRAPLLLLMTAVAVVLLITCANLASLSLARAATRGHEFALRGALGASRSRVIRQLLTESLLLALAGLALGTLMARWSFAFLEQLVPPAMTAFAQPELSGGTFALAALVACGAGLLFGLAPALAATRRSLVDALKASGRTGAASQRGRGVFVIAEVALTLVLLVAAGLLLQTFYRMRYADLGVRPERLLTLRTALPLDRYSEQSRRIAFYDEVLGDIAHLPGVVGAGYTTSVPLEWKGATSNVSLEGVVPVRGVVYDANHREVSADYLKTLGTPLIRGRYFDAGDSEQSLPVVIVNATMARAFWPDGNPVGKRITLDRFVRPDHWLTVVGVVGDVRQMGLDVPARSEMYIPFRQIDNQPWFAPRDLVVRTSGDAMALAGDVREVVHRADPTIAVSNIRTLDEVLDEDVASRRVGTTLLATFAAFALALAIVGIYGVVAYFVAQHVPEIGVRIALGADARDILRLVVLKGVKLALAGVALGAVAGAVAARLMSSLLFGVAATDPWTFAAASTLLVCVALVASSPHAARRESIPSSFFGRSKLLRRRLTC